MEFYSLNKFLKDEFDEKVIKLSLDGGFSCPNRDGKVGNSGCIFCSEKGSGDFAGSRNESIHSQMESQIKLLAPKWPKAKYIAFFQSFTNTYESVEKLKEIYDEALSYPNVVGLAIATRADCLNEEVVELLKEYNKKTLLWIELGLQSVHDKTIDFIKRGYNHNVFNQGLDNLMDNNIRVVCHVIAGFPSETIEETYETIDYLIEKNVWGIKIHMLNVSRGTLLGEVYEREPFNILSEEEYLIFLINSLKKLPLTMVVHRITGDGSKEDLIEPKWILNKKKILNFVAKYQ